MAESKGKGTRERQSIFRLRNTVQHYAWGRTDAIPRMLGLPNPDKKPWAELWMGDHPLAPSRAVLADGSDTGLDALISGDPAFFLSESASRDAGNARLSYLLKILSAAGPLSLQAHPSIEQAALGFAREDASGLVADSPERFYKDKNHKPEIIVALEPFSALCGFRAPKEIEAAFSILSKKSGGTPGGVLASVASRACAILTEGGAILSEGGDALLDFYRWLGSVPAANARAAALEAAALAPALAESRAGDPEAWRCLASLATAYPGDPGVFAALYLNRVRLERLEGFFVPAGILHSYLGGTGIELMASSDNVLRGGLSPKKVDMGALIEVLRFEAFTPRILKPLAAADGWSSYGELCPDFDLSVARGAVKRRAAQPEILLCAEGSFSLSFTGSEALPLKSGASVFVPARSGEYSLEGSGLLFRAAPGRFAS
jgi:mannose-6-phosphate isomerase